MSSSCLSDIVLCWSHEGKSEHQHIQCGSGQCSRDTHHIHKHTHEIIKTDSDSADQMIRKSVFLEDCQILHWYVKQAQSQHDKADSHATCHDRQWAHLEAHKQSEEADHNQQEAEITHDNILLCEDLIQESCRMTWVISRTQDFNMSDQKADHYML